MRSKSSEPGSRSAHAAMTARGARPKACRPHHESRGRRTAGQRRGVMSESLGLTSHKSNCNCTGCGMLRAGVCINCAEKTAALILECGPGELAAEPCSGACREAIELYFSTPPERWRAPRAL